jgi:lysophospholipase L1-like esterase
VPATITRLTNGGTVANVERSTVQTPAQLPTGKKLLFSAVLTLFILTALACVGEVALRLLPMGKYRSTPFRQYDPEIGLALIPNKHVMHSRRCFQGEVSTNSWGMRDRARTLEKSPSEFRIAMIGDSAVEAVHVRPDEVVNIRMEKLLRDLGYRNVEVMNFAVEGIGTTQEFLLYKQKVRQFHPDLVMLMFLIGNDIVNNSSTLQPKMYGIHTWYCPYYDLAPDGTLVFRPVQRRYFNSLRTYLETHSLLVYYLERTWFQINLFVQRWHGLPLTYGTYADDPLDPEWAQAWQVTGKVLAMMRDAVVADSAKFVVFPWPDIYPEWKQDLLRTYGTIPSSFNPFKPQQRLTEIAKTYNIQMEFFTSYMQKYRDEHHLQPPYFSFPCDPHLNAVGHEASAEALVQVLQERQLLPAQGPF